MTQKKRTFITLLTFAAISFVWAFISFSDLSESQLQKAHEAEGVVERAFITERMIIDGRRYKVPQTVFCFRLSNSSQNFAIHRSGGNYSDLQNGINVGDSLKVFYRISSSEYNMDVYQVEKKNQILLAYETYKKGAINQAGYIMIGGVVLLAIAFIGYTNFNLIKFLLRPTKT